MSEWDRFFDEEQRLIDSMFAQAFGAPHPFVKQPPTRAETIIDCWKTVGPHWDTLSDDGGLIIEHDLGIVEPIYFQRRKYGDQSVIEAEGVIVHRF